MLNSYSQIAIKYKIFQKFPHPDIKFKGISRQEYCV